jgi:glycosyltransferase involved in cell wall biosynthesis
MDDIVAQTIFDKCELIIINAASPGKEEKVIKKFLKRFKNIIYLKLETDPGLYAVWNLAIAMARAPYITNANLDDRLARNCYEIHLAAIESNPHIDLVYSDCYVTRKVNETFENNSAHTVLSRPEFSKEALKKSCLPNNHPMWRKSMHQKYGYFDETFKIAGDWDMWLRSVKAGSIFLKIPQILSLYYENPLGLSSDQNGNWKVEFDRVYNTYKRI